MSSLAGGRVSPTMAKSRLVSVPPVGPMDWVPLVASLPVLPVSLGPASGLPLTHVLGSGAGAHLHDPVLQNQPP